MSRRGLPITVHLLVAIVGGYIVTSGLVALAAVALPAFALMARSEAVLFASMLAFLVYLAILIWSFAAQRVFNLCVVIAACGTASWVGALGLRQLVGAD